MSWYRFRIRVGHGDAFVWVAASGYDEAVKKASKALPACLVGQRSTIDTWLGESWQPLGDVDWSVAL